jgi:hypothetical protein
MAVYTDVAADELAEFLKNYDIGELLSYKGIAEGVENSNFLLHSTAGPDDPPCLARHQLPATRQGQERRGTEYAGRPAGCDHQLS